jgi:hypothetical protein
MQHHRSFCRLRQIVECLYEYFREALSSRIPFKMQKQAPIEDINQD